MTIEDYIKEDIFKILKNNVFAVKDGSRAAVEGIAETTVKIINRIKYNIFPNVISPDDIIDILRTEIFLIKIYSDAEIKGKLAATEKLTELITKLIPSEKSNLSTAEKDKIIIIPDIKEILEFKEISKITRCQTSCDFCGGKLYENEWTKTYGRWSGNELIICDTCHRTTPL